MLTWGKAEEARSGHCLRSLFSGKAVWWSKRRKVLEVRQTSAYIRHIHSHIGRVRGASHLLISLHLAPLAAFPIPENGNFIPLAVQAKKLSLPWIQSFSHPHIQSISIILIKLYLPNIAGI